MLTYGEYLEPRDWVRSKKMSINVIRVWRTVKEPAKEPEKEPSIRKLENQGSVVSWKPSEERS